MCEGRLAVGIQDVDAQLEFVGDLVGRSKYFQVQATSHISKQVDLVCYGVLFLVALSGGLALGQVKE